MGSQGFDFIDDFGGRIPGMVIAAMLGTPDSDLEEIRRLGHAQLHLDSDDPLTDALQRRGADAGEYFLSWPRSVVQRRATT